MTHLSPINRAAVAVAGAFAVIMTAGVASAAPAPESFSPLVEKVSPAVVTITAQQQRPAAAVSGRDGMPQLPPGSPLEEFFKQFGPRGEGQGPAPRRPGRGGSALGSGFIIDADGYVVTNHHVIDSADNVKIAMTTGETLDAEVIGSDPKTDLALLKVVSDKPLPYVTFGESEDLKVGDWVMAVGNPFGLGGTVTAGIVSALGRDIGAGPFDDFIQTDAAINRGNSGGPMFNMDGEVVGVNSAIYSPNGGSVGIGFAISAAVAKPVLAQLREHGHVERGWLGVAIQGVTDEIAQAMNLEEAEGALVSAVTEESPAAKAGVEVGDVIVGFNGEEVEKSRDLPRLVAGLKPDTDATVTVLRNGEEKQLTVRLGTLADEPKVADAAPAASKGALGVGLAALDGAAREKYGVPENVKGALVANVDPDGPAAQQGIREGDVIRRVNGATVQAPSDVTKAVAAAVQAGKPTLLLVNREGRDLFVAVKPRSSAS